MVGAQVEEVQVVQAHVVEAQVVEAQVVAVQQQQPHMVEVRRGRGREVGRTGGARAGAAGSIRRR